MFLHASGNPAGRVRAPCTRRRISRNLPKSDRRPESSEGPPTGHPIAFAGQPNSPSSTSCTACSGARWTTSSCVDPTVYPPTTSPSSSTMARKASTRSCAATTFSLRAAAGISRSAPGPDPRDVRPRPPRTERRGQALAKRDGAVTLRERPDAWALITASLGVPDVKNAEELLERWKPRLVPREPWVFDPSNL